MTSSTLDKVRSRHLLVGEPTYRTPEGDRVRLGYVTRTGMVFVVDVRTARYLESGEFHEISSDALDYLADVEAIVPAHEDELAIVTQRLHSRSSGPGYRRFAILPTAYCNMMCSYCGQEHEKNNALRHERAARTIARVTKAFDDPDTLTLNVMWFGGEPLLGLRIIREMSAEFVAAARQAKKPYQADITTNGSLLTERTLGQLYRDCQVRFVELTIDGPAEVHDKRRLRRNGAPSFDHIVGLVSDVVRHGKFPGLGFGIRSNIDIHNENFIPDLLGDLACRGLGGDDRVRLSLAPVHSWGNDVTDREMGRADYARKEAQWLTLAYELGFTAAWLPRRPRGSTCLATTKNAEVIDPAGKVYSCSEHPLVPNSRDAAVIATIETLKPGAKRPEGAFDGWYDELSDRKWPCSSCAFLPVCGGGCPKLWHEGDLACPPYKYNWAERLDLVAKDMGLLADE